MKLFITTLIIFFSFFFSRFAIANEEYELTQSDIDQIYEFATNASMGIIFHEIGHLIVDEFQDISKKRAEIIRNVEKKCQSKLFLVGDDWQSINSFSGSNVKLMLSRFQKIFGDHKKINLNYTYRFNDKICKLTKRFVEKDEDLEKKDFFL